MAALVSVSSRDKEFKVKESALTVQILPIIFKLDANSGIYIHSSDGEIVLPNEAGKFRLDAHGLHKLCMLRYSVILVFYFSLFHTIYYTLPCTKTKTFN